MIVDAPDHATIAAASVAINAYGAVKTKTIVLSAKAGKVTTHRIRLLRLERRDRGRVLALRPAHFGYFKRLSRERDR